MDQQRFLRRQKISEKLWAAENYRKILWVAELGRRKITEKQISGGRFQAADILGCKILDVRPGSIKKAAKKIGNLGGGPGGRKKAAENFGIF